MNDRNLVERIDVSKIRGRFEDGIMIDGEYRVVAGGDDTIESIRLVAQKLNEVIDRLAALEPHTHD